MSSVTDKQQLSILSQNTTLPTEPRINKNNHYYATELQSLISEINTTSSSSQPALHSNTQLADIYVSGQVLIRLRRWWSNPNSELLWIQEHIGPDIISSISKGILALTQKANLPVAAWQYIHASAPGGDVSNYTTLSPMMLSLIQQIIQSLPSEFESSIDFGPERFRKLDGSHESVEHATRLLKDLLQLVDQPFIIVIEGLQMIEREKDQYVQSGLRGLLKLLQHPHEDHASRGMPIKTLLITPGQTRLLINEVQLANRCEAPQSRVRKEGLQSSLFAKELLMNRTKDRV